MRSRTERNRRCQIDRDVLTELLILSDGTILAHNLTPAMAAVLLKLDPDDNTMKQRVLAGSVRAPGRPLPS